MKNEITILSVVKKNKKYLVTTTDGEYRFDEDTLLQYQLFKEATFSKEVFSDILTASKRSETFNKALRYLGYGLRSEAEMRTYLRDEVHIDDIIQRLFDLSYLDDQRLAHQLVDYYQRSGKGPLFIHQKCIEKKIALKFINEALKGLDEDMELSMIEADYVKQSSKMQKYPILKQKQYFKDRYMRYGFHPQVVLSWIERTLFIDDSDTMLQYDYDKVVRKQNQTDDHERLKKQKIIASLRKKGYSYDQIKEFTKRE